MSRVSRLDLLYEGCYAHIISRSIRKIKLFNDEADFIKFKELLNIVKKKAKFKLFHYCVMQTHFHLAVEMSGVRAFSAAMRDLKRSYVYYYHEKYRLSGPLWRERFRSLLIENEDYLYMCGRYIEHNPVKAGLVEQSLDWPYSSSRYYEKKKSDDLIDEYAKEYHEIEDVVLDAEEFENGSIIGSSFFKFQFFEGQKKSRRVP